MRLLLLLRLPVKWYGMHQQSLRIQHFERTWSRESVGNVEWRNGFRHEVNLWTCDDESLLSFPYKIRRLSPVCKPSASVPV